MKNKSTFLGGVVRQILLFVLFINLILITNVYADDTPGAASALAVNTSSSGALASPDDVDWWVVTIPSDGSLFIETNSDQTLDIDLHMYDNIGTNQIASYDISVGARETTHKNNLAIGTYYIRATRYSGSGSYTISCTYTASSLNNDSEINDTPEQALTISPNSSTQGHFGYYYNGYTDGYDWYKVTIPSDGKVIFRTTSDATGDIDLHMFDMNGTNQIASYDTSVGIHEATHKNNLKAGTYYLRLTAYSGYGSYSLECVFEAIDKTNDPEANDEVTQALAINSNSTVTGHLGYYNNNETDIYDWYKVTTNHDGKLFITTNSSETLDIDLYMYDQNGTNQVAGYDISTGSKETTHKDNLGAGTYFIKVYGYSGYGSYELICEFTPQPLANDIEPNNEYATAKLINIEQVYTGHIAYYFEGVTDYYDYFTFNLNSSIDTLFVRMESDTTTDTDIYLYDAAQNSVASSAAGGWGLSELIVKLAPALGAYYLKIYGYSGFGGYSIKVSSTRIGDITVGVEEEENLLPAEFTLYQNYPNPFNPETTIKFDIPESDFVTLKIYDVLGNEIKTLVNENKSPGSYNVKFNGRGLASGMYIYKLSTSKFTSIKKLLLVK